MIGGPFALLGSDGTLAHACDGVCLMQNQVPAHPPDAWRAAHRVLRILGEPLERFFHVEAASGALLAVAAAVALVWANSPAHGSYDALWHVMLGARVGRLELVQPLRFWINEGLMTAFFYVVGLEIAWEVHEGALSTLRRAALPVVAALGGMLAPASIFLALNTGSAAARGWGIPIATDIAFAVAVLTMLARRVPSSLRVFLLAIAVIDDVGAILVIAVFYSSHFSIAGLGLSLIGAVLVYALRKLGGRRAWMYAPPALLMWSGLLMAGIHPTLAGVALGLMTPVQAWYGRKGFAAASHAIADEVGGGGAGDERELFVLLNRARTAGREAVPPAMALKARLHPAVAFGVLPLFALANAGARVGEASLSDRTSRFAALGIVVGLVIGKPLGVFLASFAAVKARIAALPDGLSWLGVVLVGTTAGIGFTMAIFIAELAFDEDSLLATARLSVLVASATAATLGIAIGVLGWPRKPGRS